MFAKLGRCGVLPKRKNKFAFLKLTLQFYRPSPFRRAMVKTAVFICARRWAVLSNLLRLNAPQLKSGFYYRVPAVRDLQFRVIQRSYKKDPPKVYILKHVPLVGCPSRYVRSFREDILRCCDARSGGWA